MFYLFISIVKIYVKSILYMLYNLEYGNFMNEA